MIPGAEFPPGVGDAQKDDGLASLDARLDREPFHHSASRESRS